MAIATNTHKLGKDNEFGVEENIGITTTLSNVTINPSITDNVTVLELGTSKYDRRVVFTINALEVPTLDDTTNGAGGSVLLATLPEGHIFHPGGSYMKLSSVAAGTGGIADDAVLDIAVGTVAAGASQETLGTTTEDIVTKDDITLAAGAAANELIVDPTGGGTFDGSATAVKWYLNVACTAAKSSGSDTLTLTGTISIPFMWCDDD